jgi:hypothetical protein
MTPAALPALLRESAYPHPAGQPRCIETHISWVLIAGDHAYKIKKPVDFGFLDFSTLAKRRACCAEEVRLNRRLAPDLYLGVVEIRGAESAAHIGGDGPLLDYAVWMRAFPADATLDREAEVSPAQIDAIAKCVAAFHASIERASIANCGTAAERALEPVRENFRLLAGQDLGVSGSRQRDALRDWSEAEAARLAGHFVSRCAGGFIRECHGDLHLGNIAWVDNAPLIFDGIEFNPSLRCIDIMSEVAFLMMDLMHRGMDALAWRFLDAWLARTGDFSGLAALRFYQVYRAMVRLKVARLRASQGQPGACDDGRDYLDLAERFGKAPAPFLVLMHGPSGSGKSWVSQHLLENLGLIRLRSDVERKRLAGLDALARSHSAPGDGLYTPAMSERTYRHLLDTAAALLGFGLPVVVDATFLDAAARQPFLLLAGQLGVPLRILSLAAPTEVLRARLLARAGSDASEADVAVLAAQMARALPLSASERGVAVGLDSNLPLPATNEAWRTLLRV